MSISSLYLLLPLQGALLGGIITQGDALGFELIGPSGRIVYGNYYKYVLIYDAERSCSPLVGRRADIKWPLHHAGCRGDDMHRRM